jgi:hypothetical protein
MLSKSSLDEDAVDDVPLLGSAPLPVLRFLVGSDVLEEDGFGFVGIDVDVIAVADDGDDVMNPSGTSNVTFGP